MPAPVQDRRVRHHWRFHLAFEGVRGSALSNPMLRGITSSCDPKSHSSWPTPDIKFNTVRLTEAYLHFSRVSWSILRLLRGLLNTQACRSHLPSSWLRLDDEHETSFPQRNELTFGLTIVGFLLSRCTRFPAATILATNMSGLCTSATCHALPATARL